MFAEPPARLRAAILSSVFAPGLADVVVTSSTGLSDRAHVLVERARVRAASGTALRDRVDVPLQELKRALLSGEVDAARAAELQVVELLAGGAP